MKLNGLSTPRGSIQQKGANTLNKEQGQLTEVTCDKAPLTKHEYVHVQNKKDKQVSMKLHTKIFVHLITGNLSQYTYVPKLKYV